MSEKQKLDGRSAKIAAKNAVYREAYGSPKPLGRRRPAGKLVFALDELSVRRVDDAIWDLVYNYTELGHARASLLVRAIRQRLGVVCKRERSHPQASIFLSSIKGRLARLQVR